MQTIDRSQFTIGWICALPVEQVAALEMLDEEYGPPSSTSDNDDNVYALGRIQQHNIVVTLMPQGEYGRSSAAIAARDMVHSFPNVRLGLMVGVGGGVPTRHDIRLGDIVVSAPNAGMSGVLQYDFGKAVQERSFQLTGHLDQPPRALRNAVAALQAKHIRRRHTIQEQVEQALQRNDELVATFGRPSEATDLLFQSEVVHADVCSTGRCASDAPEKLTRRSPRNQRTRDPSIHYGLIGSADSVIKDAMIRDRLSAEHDILCFEMEAAGLMNNFPCLVVRGICDYADSHKMKEWQGYAAMTAAAYTRELLSLMVPTQVEQEARLAVAVEKAVTTAIKPVQETIHEMHQRIRDASFHQWLAAPDPKSNYRNALRTRHVGTGSWLSQDSRYKAWQNAANSILWLSGIPGCGKTVLSSTVIEALETKQATRPGQSTLFFYFDFNDTRKQSLDSAIRSLLVQFCQQHPEVRKIGQAFWREHRDGHEQPSTPALSSIFLQMLQASPKTFLVLDALDECPHDVSQRNRREVLEWVRNICTAEVRGVHLLITSRPEQDIISTLQGIVPSQSHIQLNAELMTADINAYIDQQVRRYVRLARWHDSKTLQDEIETTLSQMANGMFRWVALQIDEIEDCRTEKHVREALASLPETLNDTYSRMVERLPHRTREDAIRMLQFLVYSERPLTVVETIEAIAIEFEPRPRYNPAKKFGGSADLLHVCSSFVLIAEGEKAEGDATTATTIQLSHFSVREYFLSRHVHNSVASSFTVHTGHAVIAKGCMVYLLSLYDDLLGERPPEGALGQYCAQYWSTYARLADEDDQMQSLATAFYLEGIRVYRKAVTLHQPESEHYRTYIRNGSALYYASHAGQAIVSRTLIERGVDVNAQGGIYGNALQAASYRGHEQVVRLLLDKNADVNAQGGNYGTALQAASYGGHEQIVRLLLDKGADVNAQGGIYGNALQAASYGGHEQIVRLLLDKDADLNAQGGDYGNALQAATNGGHERIVRLLLDKDADLNAQGGDYGNALQAATYGGHERIVRLLLDKGADVNAQGGQYGSALQAASYKGHEQIVQLLLHKDADVNAQGGIYGNALQAASDGGHEQIVRLLLEKNVGTTI